LLSSDKFREAVAAAVAVENSAADTLRAAHAGEMQNILLQNERYKALVR
jgi:hypothetical protein